MGTPPPIQLANLGMADSLIIMVLALVVFGPRKLPQIGRQIGKLMYEFRKASNDFKFQMEEELRSSEEADRRKKEEEERVRQLALAAPTEAAVADSASQVSETTSAAFSSSETGATETLTEDSLPRIQPPSTGEQVPAAKSASPEEITPEGINPEASVAANAGSEDTEVLDGVSPVSGPASSSASDLSTEQAAHHG
jgi:sec-independent protein translocase protein TatB